MHCGRNEIEGREHRHGAELALEPARHRGRSGSGRGRLPRRSRRRGRRRLPLGRAAGRTPLRSHHGPGRRPAGRGEPRPQPERADRRASRKRPCGSPSGTCRSSASSILPVLGYAYCRHLVVAGTTPETVWSKPPLVISFVGDLVPQQVEMAVERVLGLSSPGGPPLVFHVHLGGTAPRTWCGRTIHVQRIGGLITSTASGHLLDQPPSPLVQRRPLPRRCSRRPAGRTAAGRRRASGRAFRPGNRLYPHATSSPARPDPLRSVAAGRACMPERMIDRPPSFASAGRRVPRHDLQCVRGRRPMVAGQGLPVAREFSTPATRGQG